MLVREAYDVLRKLMKVGHGNLELYGIHGASGVSYEMCIYGSLRKKDSSDDIGPLDELNNGDLFVPVYLD